MPRRSLLSKVVRLPLRLVPKGKAMPVLTGELRGSKWIAGAASHRCWIGTYEKEVQAVFTSKVRSGDVVYDLGANAGFYTLLASRLVGDDGHVYAFEPNPENLHYLNEHVR